MNVKEIQGAVLSEPAGKRGKPEGPGGADFQKILQQAHAVHKAGEDMDFDRARGTGEIQGDLFLPISGISSTTPAAAASEARRQGAVTADRALALLERYQASLADAKCPLREIRPLLQSLSAEVKDLANCAGKLPDSDPLHKIITEVGILSSVEIERFNRGDYC